MTKYSIFYRTSIAVIALFLLGTFTPAEGARILFDRHHAQTAGNADWVLDGAYSQLGEVLREAGHIVESTTGPITASQLNSVQVLVLPEPNLPYSEEEMALIVEFVHSGGGLFLIGDHAGSDRNRSGMDSVDIFNKFLPKLGMEFEETWFSEAPVKPLKDAGFISREINRGIGAWGAGSLRLIDSDARAHFKTGDGLVYVATSEPGAGRVVALGDSAIFSDGEGSDGSQLHDSFHSFLYDHPQFAANVMWWLAREEHKWSRVPSQHSNRIQSADIIPSSNDVWIDYTHDADDSDKLFSFANMLEEMGLNPSWRFEPLPDDLGELRMLVSMAPDRPWTAREITAVSKWVRSGGILILTGGSDFAPLGRPLKHNRLLEHCAAILRFCDDQVQDSVFNTGRPWGPVLQDVVMPDGTVASPVIAWGSCSLSDRNNNFPENYPSGRLTILARGGADAIVTDGNRNGITGPVGAPPVVIAMERLGRGKLLVSGAPLLVDFNWPCSSIYPMEYHELYHDTPGFIRTIITHMLESTVR